VRLFFALWPTAEEAEALTARAQCWVPEGARAVPVANLHLTVAFLGEQSEAVVPELIALGERAALSSVDVALEHIGVFGRARVLWIAPRVPTAPLTNLRARLGGVLSEVGFSVDGRRFRPHVTLARKVPSSALEGLDLRVGEPRIAWTQSSFCLVCSRTLPTGAQYKRLWQKGPC